MNKQNKNQHIHHHTYNWDKGTDQLLFFLIVVISIITALSWVTVMIKDDANIYDSCVDACSKRHFSDYEIGKSFSADNTISNPDSNRMMIYKPTIKEFDRNPCIDSCNKMLLVLKDEP